MTLGWMKNGSQQPSIDFDLGAVPIMIRVSNVKLIKYL